tara:strand:+ start:558 stop:764 length:207 start_codon:yes stop_codon:yes gene_type:complete
MTKAMDKILAWKIMPRVMMLVMTIMYIRVIEWFMSLPQDVVSTQATALTATVTGALTGAFAVWVGSEK